MNKNVKRIIGASFFVILLSAGFAWWSVTNSAGLNRPCAFCNDTVIQTHTFYEDELVRGMCTHKPIAPGHCMIVVKRHVENLDELTDEEFLATGQLLQKINTATQIVRGPSSYLILEKNGVEVGQTVPHVHVHFIPKNKTGSPISQFGFLWNFVANIFHRPIPIQELSKNVDVMKLAIEKSVDQS